MARSDDAGGSPAPAGGHALRLFVAIPLAVELREAVHGVQRTLRTAGTRLRWVETGNLHVTLRFLGSVPATRVDDVARAAEEASRQVGPFLLSLGSCGCFPSPRKARVLWVGISDGARELEALAGALEGALERLGFPREERAFRPHVTLARVPEGARLPGLDGWLEAWAGRSLGSMTVEAIDVMESRLRPEGPLYRSLRRVLLGGGRPSGQGE